MNNIFCELAYLPGLMINNNPRVSFVARHQVGTHLDPGAFSEFKLLFVLLRLFWNIFVVVVVVVVVCAMREHVVFCLSRIVHGVVCCKLRICLCRWFASSDFRRILGFPQQSVEPWRDGRYC